MINLTDLDNDNYCRYVIPIPEISVKGKRMFTEITNLKKICQTVNLDESKLMKTLSVKLGTYSFGGKLIGEFEEKTVRKLIVQLIKQLITCPRCNLPEVNNGLCRACYWSGSVY